MKVTVPFKPKFPSACSKCLAETDLVTYVLKRKEKKEEHRFNVPICKSCKKTLLRETRKKWAIAFAILAPILWSLFYFVDYLPQISWTGIIDIILTGENFQRLIIFIILVILFLPLIIPFIALYFTISPSTVTDWPVKVVKYDIYSGVFSFENTPYARLFVAANPHSTSS